MYVSWLHEKNCCIISFQIIRKNLVCFQNRIAYFDTDLRKTKYLILQLCVLSLNFQFHFTINFFGSFTDCFFVHYLS